MIVPLLAACLASTVPGSSTEVVRTDLPVPARAAPLPLASLDDALDVAGQAVAAQEIRTRLTVAVEINGAGPFQFVVDSGADRSAIGQRLSRLLELPSRDCFRLHGMAGTSLVPAVLLHRLRLGSGVLENVAAPVLPDAALGADGLIGIDALAGQRLKLDFEARSITLEDASRRSRFLAGEPGDIVVTARRQRGQLILAAASSVGVGMLAVIDTGSEVTIGNGALRARVFGRRQQQPPRRVELISVTGQPVAADLVVLPELTIGGLTLRNLPVAFADVPPFALFGLADTPSVLLGTDVLQAFRRVTLDFRRRKVRFTLRPSGHGVGRARR